MSPRNVTVPGGTVTYTVKVVEDDSAFTGWLEKLEQGPAAGPYTSLSGLGNCGYFLSGVSYQLPFTCSWSQSVSGSTGDVIDNQIRATGHDNDTPPNWAAFVDLEVGIVKRSSTISISGGKQLTTGDSWFVGANLGGTYVATGSITFRLYGPAAPTCTGTPLQTDTKAVVNHSLAFSENHAFSTPGTYHWRASYSGDGNNNAVSTPCGASEGTFVVTDPDPGGGGGTSGGGGGTSGGGPAPSGSSGATAGAGSTSGRRRKCKRRHAAVARKKCKRKRKR